MVQAQSSWSSCWRTLQQADSSAAAEAEPSFQFCCHSLRGSCPSGRSWMLSEGCRTSLAESIHFERSRFCQHHQSRIALSQSSQGGNDWNIQFLRHDWNLVRYNFVVNPSLNAENKKKRARAQPKTHGTTHVKKKERKKKTFNLTRQKHQQKLFESRIWSASFRSKRCDSVDASRPQSVRSERKDQHSQLAARGCGI